MGIETLTPTILYVDDQPSHRALFEKAFRARYQILSAGSGQEALEIIKDKEIFLIIADHNMPGMTGIDFLQEARKVSPKARQALLSAYLDDGIVKEASRKAEAALALPKPWKLDQMREFIEKAYRGYEIDRVPPATESPESIVERPSVDWQHLAHFIERLETHLDRREARRVFLNYVEPRIKEFVPILKRPAHPLLRQAQQEALRGNFDALQKILGEYLKQEGLANTLQVLTGSPDKVIH